MLCVKLDYWGFLFGLLAKTIHKSRALLLKIFGYAPLSYTGGIYFPASFILGLACGFSLTIGY